VASQSFVGRNLCILGILPEVLLVVQPSEKLHIFLALHITETANFIFRHNSASPTKMTAIFGAFPAVVFY